MQRLNLAFQQHPFLLHWFLLTIASHWSRFSVSKLVIMYTISSLVSGHLSFTVGNNIILLK